MIKVLQAARSSVGCGLYGCARSGDAQPERVGVATASPEHIGVTDRQPERVGVVVDGPLPRTGPPRRAPGRVRVVDHFDGDGNLDIASVNDDGGVSLLMGSGDGAFDPAVSLPGGTGPGAIAAADLDLDGRLDIVLTHSGATDGASARTTSSFCSPMPMARSIRSSAPGRWTRRPWSPGDLNADQKPELATANDGESLSVFLGKGDGTSATREAARSVLASACGIAVSDFNGDDKQDLITTNSTDRAGQK